jgi:hypothetical protein
MLAQVAVDVDCPLDYPSVRDACNRDPLQIAEYLLLVSGDRIGPLRHSLANQMRTVKPLVASGAHVELVNLGAPQVYTTNYDDIIEHTYRSLGRPVEVVALPRDVAKAHGGHHASRQVPR